MTSEPSTESVDPATIARLPRCASGGVQDDTQSPFEFPACAEISRPSVTGKTNKNKKLNK